jgi:hypothetical protein
MFQSVILLMFDTLDCSVYLLYEMETCSFITAAEYKQWTDF